MKTVRKPSVLDALQLDVAERIKLVEAIWDTIAEVPEAVKLTDAQRQELDKRLAAYYRNPQKGSPWPEVKARILALEQSR